jgi:hypothetical protein
MFFTKQEVMTLIVLQQKFVSSEINIVIVQSSYASQQNNPS